MEPDDKPRDIRFGGSASSANDDFTWPCHSVERAATYARYFSFDIHTARDVRVELFGSQVAEAALSLRPGTAVSGVQVVRSHNPDGPARARIDARLEPGTYTVEAAAAGPGNGGTFDLRIEQGPPQWAPPAECRQDINVVIDVGGLWQGGQYAEPCWSQARPGSHARWYTFTIAQPFDLNTSLFAPDADAFLYLRAGRNYNGIITADLSVPSSQARPSASPAARNWISEGPPERLACCLDGSG